MTAPAGILDRLLGAPMSAAHPTGLLTADDYAEARRQGLLGLGSGLLAASGGGPQFQNLNQRLAAGLQGGQGAYQQALDRAAAQAIATQKYEAGAFALDEAKRDATREQALAAAREQIIAANPMPDGTDAASLATWIDKVLPSFIRIGDTTTLGKLSEIRKSLDDQTKNPQQIDTGGTVQLRDPRTGKIVYEVNKTPAPRDNAAGVEQRAEMTRQRAFTREQQLARQFEARTKDYAEIADKAGSVFASAQDPSAAGDLSLIFAYMKVLDPGSVVREGEFATAAQAGSIPERIVAQYNRVLRGERLSPEIRADFVSRTRALVGNARKRLGTVVRQYERRAKTAGIDPSMVVYDYFDGLEDGLPPGGSAPPLSSFNFGGGTR